MDDGILYLRYAFMRQAKKEGIFDVLIGSVEDGKIPIKEMLAMSKENLEQLSSKLKSLGNLKTGSYCYHNIIGLRAEGKIPIVSILKMSKINFDKFLKRLSLRLKILERLKILGYYDIIENISVRTVVKMSEAFLDKFLKKAILRLRVLERWKINHCEIIGSKKEGKISVEDFCKIPEKEWQDCITDIETLQSKFVFKDVFTNNSEEEFQSENPQVTPRTFFVNSKFRKNSKNCWVDFVNQRVKYLNIKGIMSGIEPLSRPGY